MQVIHLLQHIKIYHDYHSMLKQNEGKQPPAASTVLLFCALCFLLQAVLIGSHKVSLKRTNISKAAYTHRLLRWCTNHALLDRQTCSQALLDANE